MMINWLFSLLAGLVSAWTINYLGDVLPQTRKLSAPICLACGEKLSWKTSLTLGKCPSCGAAPSRRHYIVMTLIPPLVVWLWMHPSTDLMPFPAAAGWARLLSLILVIYFGVIFVIDTEHLVILDQVSIVGALLMLGLGSWLHGWQTTLLGGLGGYGFMYALYGLGILYVRFKNRRETVIDDDNVALGFGDVKLAGVLGLLLGWPDILIMNVLALLIGGVSGILLMGVNLARKTFDPNITMPYAPYLVLVTAYIILL